MTIYITAVHMEPADASDHQHIAQVMWTEPTKGEINYSSREAVVDWLTKGGDARVRDSHGEVSVGVVNDDPPYIRTHADGRHTDNLLSLPRY